MELLVCHIESIRGFIGLVDERGGIGLGEEVTVDTILGCIELKLHARVSEGANCLSASIVRVPSPYPSPSFNFYD